MSVRPLRRGLAAGAGLACLAGGLVAAPAAHAASTGLVLNEVYSHGGSANQPFNTKFVEILNKSDAAIDLSAYGLAYSAAANTGLGNTCALAGTVAAGGYFVVTVGSNGSTGAPVTGQQNCTNINPSGSAGAYTLLRDGATVDLVGWGTAVRYETKAAAVNTTSNATPGGIARTPNGTDTDDNSTDFAWADLPTPGASNDKATDPGTGTGPQSKTIAEIQGAGASTPLPTDQKVRTKGVVTATYPTGGFGGIYLQTPGTGGTPKVAGEASDGLFVYSSWAANNTAVGDCVTVEGTPAEFYGLTQLSGKVFVTKLAADQCAPVQATPLTLPLSEEAKEAHEGMLVAPQGTWTITNNYQLNQYGQLGLTPGDKPLYQATDVVTPDRAAAYEAANQAKYLTLDDGSSWDFLKKVKDSPLPYLSAATPMRTASQVTFTKPVILDYRFQWNLQPTGHVVGAEDADSPVAAENDRPAAPPAVGGDLQLAAFNVLNYFTDLGQDEAGCEGYPDRFGNPVATNYCEVRGAYTAQAFADQKAKIVAAINGLDAEVVALMEIENSAGISYVDHARDHTLAELVASLNKAAGTTRWAYAESPTVVPGTEDIIRTAFLYDPSKVDALGPSLIDLDDAFANARYPLAQKFKAKKSGKPFVAIANHFKSKGCAKGMDADPYVGCWDEARTAQAAQLTAWASEMFDEQATFLLGDFNAYSRENPVRTIEAAGYTNVVKKYAPASATYQFSGRLGSLDHVFANAKALQLVTGAGVWDINADESIAFQYSRRHYNVVDFYAPDPYASSDHDPVVVGISTRK